MKRRRKKKVSTPQGFEPWLPKGTGLAGQRLNRSAKASHLLKEKIRFGWFDWILILISKKKEKKKSLWLMSSSYQITGNHFYNLVTADIGFNSPIRPGIQASQTSTLSVLNVHLGGNLFSRLLILRSLFSWVLGEYFPSFFYFSSLSSSLSERQNQQIHRFVLARADHIVFPKKE